MQVEQLKKSGSMQEAWLTAAKADASSQAAARQRLQEVYADTTSPHLNNMPDKHQALAPGI